MSWIAALVLGAATTGGATASMMSDFGGDVPRYAILPGFWAVWFAPPMTEETDYAVFLGVNTTVWTVAWKISPNLGRSATTAIVVDAIAGFAARLVPRKPDTPSTPQSP